MPVKYQKYYHTCLLIDFCLLFTVGCSDNNPKIEHTAARGYHNLNSSVQSTKVGLPAWIYGVYSGTAPGYNMLGNDGKPAYVFGESVKVPPITRKLQIDRGGDKILLRAKSSDGSSYLSTAEIKVTETSENRVVIDTKFDNGSSGTPVKLVLRPGVIEFNEYRSPKTELKKVLDF